MSNESSQSLDSPANEAVMARLLELENRTGYRMQQCNGQRRYWNPNWTGSAPARGTEVFVGKIPRDLFEDEIVPVFEKVGQIYELRLMMDFSGYNRGYAFVTFTTKEDAFRAIELLDNFEIRPGMKIGVCRSVDNCKLFVGSIPKDKSQEEIRQAMCEITEDVTDVIVYPGTNPGELNRGFAFVEYASHRAAAMARRKLIPGRITLFGYEVAVDWADPESDVNDDMINRVKNVFVRNLKLTTSEYTVWAAFNSIRPGSIERVKKIEDRDFAFVHFHKREDALYAVQMMNGQLMDGQEVHVSLAKPNAMTKQSLGNKLLGNTSNNMMRQNSYPDVMVNTNVMMNRSNSMRAQPQSFNMFGANMSNFSNMNSDDIGPMCTVRSFPSRPKSTTPTMDMKDFSHNQLRQRNMTPTPQMFGSPADSYWKLGAGGGPSNSQMSERRLRPVVTMEHIASIKCPVTLLSELCAHLNIGSGGPHFALFLDEQSGKSACRYVYQVWLAGKLYTPPLSSETIEEAKRFAARYVIDQIAPWVESKLDSLASKPATQFRNSSSTTSSGSVFSATPQSNNSLFSPIFCPTTSTTNFSKPKTEPTDSGILDNPSSSFSSTLNSGVSGGGQQNYPDYLRYLNTMASQSIGTSANNITSMQQ